MLRRRVGGGAPGQRSGGPSAAPPYWTRRSAPAGSAGGEAAQLRSTGRPLTHRPAQRDPGAPGPSLRGRTAESRERSDSASRPGTRAEQRNRPERGLQTADSAPRGMVRPNSMSTVARWRWPAAPPTRLDGPRPPASAGGRPPESPRRPPPRRCFEAGNLLYAGDAGTTITDPPTVAAKSVLSGSSRLSRVGARCPMPFGGASHGETTAEPKPLPRGTAATPAASPCSVKDHSTPSPTPCPVSSPGVRSPTGPPTSPTKFHQVPVARTT